MRVHRELGDRRDHFVGIQDMIDLVRQVVDGRREREFAPTVEAVRETIAAAEADSTPDAVLTRMRETLEVMEMFDQWHAEMAKLPRTTQLALLRMGARLARFLPKAAE